MSGATAARTGAEIAAALDRLCPDGPLGVAVSGGSDSTALLVAAASRAPGARRVEAATVDHRLRPESAEEAAAVARLCVPLGVPHATLVWQSGWSRSERSGNLQAAAREARMRLLGAWARERGLAAVLLGHTLDDQAETVLLRLARGSGADGLSGMRERTVLQGTLWLRPLLRLRREALRDWLRAQGHGWIDDPSNEDPRFDRVRARQALAALGPLGIGAESLAATADRLAMQRRVLEAARETLAARSLNWGSAGEARIDLATLDAAEEDTGLRLLADVMMRVAGAIYRPRLAALSAFRAALGEGTPGRTLAGCAASSDGRTAVLWRERAACEGPVPLGHDTLWDGRWRLSAEGPWPEAEVAALGEDGLADLARAVANGEWTPAAAWEAAPRAARAAVPALRDREGKILACPPAGFLDAVAAASGCRISLKDMASAPDP